MISEREEGILEACRSLHQFCLEEGMSCRNDAETIAYTKMIVHLNHKFGHLRQTNGRGLI